MSHQLQSENVTPLHLGSGDADERATVANFEPAGAARPVRGDRWRGGRKPQAVETPGPADAEAGCRQGRGRARSWQRGLTSEAPWASGNAAPATTTVSTTSTSRTGASSTSRNAATRRTRPRRERTSSSNTCSPETTASSATSNASHGPQAHGRSPRLPVTETTTRMPRWGDIFTLL